MFDPKTKAITETFLSFYYNDTICQKLTIILVV